MAWSRPPTADPRVARAKNLRPASALHHVRPAALFGYQFDPVCADMPQEHRPADRPMNLWADSTASGEPPENVYISYTPADTKYLDMLMTQLKVLVDQGLIQVSTYKDLHTGSNWQEETGKAIERSMAAILLITPDYLVSPAAKKDQLPRLLARAEESGTAILPLLVIPSQFDQIPHLYRFKPFNSPSRTLVDMRFPEKQRFLVSVAEAVREMVYRKRGGGGRP